MASDTQDLVATVSPEKAATEILISAHQHDISCISMNQQGTMIATCSSKVHSDPSGVRLYHSKSGNKLFDPHDFRLYLYIYYTV